MLYNENNSNLRKELIKYQGSIVKCKAKIVCIKTSKGHKENHLNVLLKDIKINNEDIKIHIWSRLNNMSKRDRNKIIKLKQNTIINFDGLVYSYKKGSGEMNYSIAIKKIV